MLTEDILSSCSRPLKSVWPAMVNGDRKSAAAHFRKGFWCMGFPWMVWNACLSSSPQWFLSTEEYAYPCCMLGAEIRYIFKELATSKAHQLLLRVTEQGCRYRWCGSSGSIKTKYHPRGFWGDWMLIASKKFLTCRSGWVEKWWRRQKEIAKKGRRQKYGTWASVCIK